MEQLAVFKTALEAVSLYNLPSPRTATWLVLVLRVEMK